MDALNFSRAVEWMYWFSRHEDRSSLISVYDRVEAYMLPNISRWASFYATKRENECCPEVYYRIADFYTCRFEETIRLLNANKKVTSTGLSGIGKSTEIVGLLMRYLKPLGTEG